MKLWADERRSGTLEFILTQPISYNAIILGKFGAAVLFGILLLALTGPFVIYVSFLTELDWQNIVSGYLATILTIMVLTSIGCLISSFNSNAVLAYLFSVFVGWLLISLNYDFMLAPLFPLSENVTYLLSQSLNFYANYLDMTQGEPGLDNLTYFLSLTILILWINRVTIEYKKQ